MSLISLELDPKKRIIGKIDERIDGEARHHHKWLHWFFGNTMYFDLAGDDLSTWVSKAKERGNGILDHSPKLGENPKWYGSVTLSRSKKEHTIHIHVSHRAVNPFQYEHDFHIPHSKADMRGDISVGWGFGLKVVQPDTPVAPDLGDIEFMLEHSAPQPLQILNG